jgi:hypothetical protein
VRTGVFDSGSLLNVRLEQQQLTHVPQAFGEVARECAADPACARAYHPSADLRTVLAHLRAHPAHVSLPSDTQASLQKVTITGPLFLQMINDEYLDSSLTSIFLPADLHTMARGRWQQVIDKRDYTTGILPTSGPISLQLITIECGDTWAALSPARIRQQASSLFAPIFTPAAAQTRQALCAAWPHDPGASGTVRSSVPTVFLNGTADGTDPPANVAAATQTMPHALLVPVPGAAHWVLNQTLNPACLLTATTAFIQSGNPPQPGALDPLHPHPGPPARPVHRTLKDKTLHQYTATSAEQTICAAALINIYSISRHS